MATGSLPILRRRLVLILVVYFFAGSISQKMIPGVDEIFPFFGWSLFSRVPNIDRRYEVFITGQGGLKIDPPVAYLKADSALVTGNEHIGRKLIQQLGGALERGESSDVMRLKRLLERNYLAKRVRYEVVVEDYRPLEKWRTGQAAKTRVLGVFESEDR